MACERGHQLRELMQLNRTALDETVEDADDFLKVANEQQKAYDDLINHLKGCAVCKVEETFPFIVMAMQGLNGDPPGMDDIVYPWNPDDEDLES